eukprot:m.35380 g.35380  ORF g.35380 m.35380 type:complete len:155 (-) comp14413_c0_seq2:156-620(-)
MQTETTTTTAKVAISNDIAVSNEKPSADPVKPIEESTASEGTEPGNRRRSSRINAPPSSSEETSATPKEEVDTVTKDSKVAASKSTVEEPSDGQADAKVIEEQTATESPKRKADDEAELSEDTVKKCKTDADVNPPAEETKVDEKTTEAAAETA